MNKSNKEENRRKLTGGQPAQSPVDPAEDEQIDEKVLEDVSGGIVVTKKTDAASPGLFRESLSGEPYKNSP